MRRRARGFNLIELMVALVIGLFLLTAFVTLLVRARDQFATGESAARLADAARHALSVLVPDVEHAGFYGFAAPATARFVRAGSVLAADAQLAQSADAVPVAGLPAGAHDCGVNFAVDVALPVEATNASWRVARDCAPTATAGGVRAGADTLTVRHAARESSAPQPGRVQVYVSQLESFVPLTLFADGHAPGTLDDRHEVRDLEVRTYYIANSSVDRPGWPALRVKALTESRGAAQFRDEEVLPGVEDLQVELGIDGADSTESTGSTESAESAESPERGTARVRFVAPGLVKRGARVVAVRLWLRIRADSTESGYRDERPMRYADVEFVPTPAEAAQRRMLVERTVALRNRTSARADTPPP